MAKENEFASMMFVLASTGIVAGCACSSPDPTPTIRAAVSEGLSLAFGATNKVSESYEAGGMNGVKAAADAWNAQNGGVGATSEYVASVLIAATTGEVTVRYSENFAQISGKTLVLTPNLPIGTVLVPGLTGAIEWACSSTTDETATFYGFAVKTMGTVPTQYAPPQCQ